MPSVSDRLEFGPPRDPASPRAFALAMLVHVLLIAALTWGVNWKRTDRASSFEAELWSSLPQEAAPRLVETAPAPPPPPPPPPAPAPREVKVAPPAPDVDIALEQEKKRKLLKQQKEAEEEQAQEREQRLQDKQKAELQAKKEKEKEKEKDKAQQAKEELAQRKVLEDAKKAEAKKQDAKEQAQQKLAQAAAEKQRQQNIDRIAGLAGATGGAEAKGSAQKSSGPSAGYAGKVRAAVKPNVIFTDDISGNPKAEIEVRTTLDGSIVSQRLVKSSGDKAWDEAAIKAVIRTGTLPRDVDGRVPTPMILEIRPRD
ncbi:cell envelope integrity protein TolA [Polaromonas sp.]|uniref:cell envelope integrity protein TolA n=1 Tax=Polaromonas sp. TaxID=1869339 RepID=UPI001798F220|nr:cell envelope integrity protein TolA [Polaromonas sp.]NMM08454.1 cell envelope integrity protein TolA [Polaromonas sp.]